MKDYFIKEIDGYHVVHILSDEEIDIIERVRELFQAMIDTVANVVENIIENVRAWIHENIDLEKLKELDAYMLPEKHNTTAYTTHHGVDYSKHDYPE